MKRIAIIVAIIVGAIVALGAIGLLLVAPEVADSAVQSKLKGVQGRTGWQVQYDDLRTTGLGGVEIDRVAVSDSSGPFLSIERVTAGLDLSSVFAGEKRLSALEFLNVELTIRVDKDGNVHPIQGLLTRPKATDTGEKGNGRTLADRLAQLPNVTAQNTQIIVEVEPGGPAVPVQSVSIETASMAAQDGGFVFDGAASLVATPGQPIQLPSKVTGRLELDRDLRPKGGKLSFDSPLSIQGIDPLPFLSLGLSGAEISSTGVLIANDVRIDVQGDEVSRLFQAKSIGVALEKLPKSLSELRLVEVTAESPVLFMDYNKAGGNSLNDIYLAMRAPQASGIIGHAKRFAQRQADRLKLEPTDPDEKGIVQGPSSVARVEKLLKRWAPQVIRINDARVVGVDDRTLVLDRKVRDISLEKASLTLEHELGANRVVIKGDFQAMGDGAALGSAHADLDIDYGKMSVSGDIVLDALDLSWAGQLLGRRLRNLVGGGTLRANVKLQSQGKKAFGAVGMISVEDLTVTAPIVAEEPLRGVTSSYKFSAKYSALAPMPAATLLEVPVYKTPRVAEGEAPPPAPPAPQGSLVVEAGKLRFNGAEASFRPAFYGFNAPKRLPTRMDIQVDIPTTDVMDLFNAVPKAIQGPTEGTKMAGTLALGLKVEVPLYRASDMKWDSKPVLNDFEVISIPNAVDVRRLMDATPVTITDSVEDPDDFERTVKLRAAKPTPAQWLLENSGLSIEDIDERRRKRDWPTVPSAASVGMAPSYVGSPQFWLSNAAATKEAKRPWNDGDELRGITTEHPLGNYVFVPIQYISRYMPLAVMTTEDNSFFTHDGFNMHALRASIERNIEAVGFKRGASTIAMQMVKNVFLNRKKLLSRKIQEAFLVFLMETAIDIPKARIMEVYLNVIEFGPRIFGIHDAAIYYFGKRPDELTIGEVAWFASIIPNPKKYHFYYQRGEISERWFARMKRYIQVMHNRERISVEERDAGLIEPPKFYKPTADEPRLRPKSVPSLWGPLEGGLVNPFAPLDANPTNPDGPTKTADPSLAPSPNGATPVPAPQNPAPTVPSSPTLN